MIFLRIDTVGMFWMVRRKMYLMSAGWRIGGGVRSGADGGGRGGGDEAVEACGDVIVEVDEAQSHCK